MKKFFDRFLVFLGGVGVILLLVALPLFVLVQLSASDKIGGGMSVNDKAKLKAAQESLKEVER